MIYNYHFKNCIEENQDKVYNYLLNIALVEIQILLNLENALETGKSRSTN